MEAASPVSAGARLDRLPISRFHWRILALIGGGMFLDAFEIYLAGGVLGALVKSGWSNLARNADFISITFAGMVVGAWLAGILGDRFGRRFSYQANLLIFGIASLAGAAAPSMTWLIVARFFMGIGLGAEIVVGYVSLSEFVPPAKRGRWVAGLAAVTNLALFMSAFLNYLIIPNFGWRWMFVIVGVGALIVWYLRKKMPESPRWLESKGRFAEADVVLKNIEEEVSRTHALPPVQQLPQIQATQRSFMALFSKQIIMRTLVGTVMLVVLNTVLYGFIAWIPTFFVKHGMSVSSSLGFTSLMALGGPIGAIIGMFLGDRIGRKRGMVIFSILAIIFGTIYANVHTPQMFALVGFCVVTVVYTLVAIAFALYVPELFPTDLRMRGAGFCNTIGRMATMATPYLVVVIYNAHDIGGVLTLMISLLAIMALVVGFLGIETRTKSLEELTPEDDEALAAATLGSGQTRA